MRRSSTKHNGRDFTSLGPSIRRLASAIGVERTGKEAIIELTDELQRYLTNLDSKLVVLATEYNTQTIKFDHVKYFVPCLMKNVYKPCGAKFKDYEAVGKNYKLADCHFLTKAIIERHVRSDIGQLRLSPEALDGIMDALQLYLVKVIESAGLITRHAGRNTMNAGDIVVALHAMSNC